MKLFPVEYYPPPIEAWERISGAALKFAGVCDSIRTLCYYFFYLT